MNEFLLNLKRQATENPMVAVGVAAAFLQSASKVVNANASRKNSKAWKREVDRRVAKSKSK